MEGPIEDTVDLNIKYPSVTERYWTKYYFIPKDRPRQGGEAEGKGVKGDVEAGGDGNGEGKVLRGVEGDGDGGGVGNVRKGGCLEKENGDSEVMKEGGKIEKEKEEAVNKNGIKRENTKRDKDDKENKGKDGAEKNGTATMDTEQDKDAIATDDDGTDRSLEDDSTVSLSSQAEEGGGAAGQRKHFDTSGHVCVMVHTNKLCLVTLSPKHPALAPGMEITEVSYSVGKFNRLDNQVSGKGKRGAQMMGPQSPVCVITCADGSQHAVLAGIHGKLVEVNERLVTNPKLASERPDAEGYLAVILPPLRNGDAPLRRLITSEEYWGQER